jgi:hypothetical protein
MNVNVMTKHFGYSGTTNHDIVWLSEESRKSQNQRPPIIEVLNS